jgi:hypothetical protein
VDDGEGAAAMARPVVSRQRDTTNVPTNPNGRNK